MKNRALLLEALLLTAISLTLSSNPDVAINTFQITKWSAGRLVQDFDAKLNFESNIVNVALGGAEDNVDQSDQNNYQFSVILSDGDLSTGTYSQQLQFSAKVTDETKLKKGLLSQRLDSLTFTGEVTVKIPRDKCDNTTFLCLQVAFDDDQPLNNYHCKNITSFKSCSDDALDLYVELFRAHKEVVEPGENIHVDLVYTVKPYGQAILEPNEETKRHLYSISIYLTKGKSLDVKTDEKIEALPAEVNAATRQTVSSEILVDGSGFGLKIPNVLPNKKSLCGPSFLAVNLDHGKFPGAVEEVDEDNNVYFSRILIHCSGDLFALSDFSFDLGYKQNNLYVAATTPLVVNATVYYFGSLKFGGKSNFKLELYVHESTNLMVENPPNPVDVTKSGALYPLTRNPLQPLSIGEVLDIKNIEISVDGNKFKTNNRISHLILRVKPAVGDLDTDNITENDYASQPIPISTLTPNDQVDYKYPQSGDTFDIHQELLATDGTVKPATVVTSGRTDQSDPGNTLSFEGVADLAGLTNLGSMKATLYWAKQKQLTDTDIESGIPVEFQPNQGYPRIVLPLRDAPVMPMPTDTSYCGAIYGIIFIEKLNDPENKDPLKYNNFAGDLVTLKCNSADQFALTELKLKAPSHAIFADMETPLKIQATISCTKDNCNSFDGSTYLLQLYLDSDTLDNGGAIALKTVAAKMANVVGGRRSEITIVESITIPVVSCTWAKYLGVKILQWNGLNDAWTNNDYLTVELPSLECDPSNTKATVDLKPTFSLPSTVAPEKNMPFNLSVDITTTNDFRFEESVWPHFQFLLFISEDETFEATLDYVIPYEMTKCQFQTLTRQMENGRIDLSDPDGPMIAANGLERFCDKTVYIGVFIDSWDRDTSDAKIGQVHETLESNNVALESARSVISGSQMCQDTIPTQQLTLALVNITGVEVFRPRTQQELSVEVEVTNEYNEPIRGGSDIVRDFEIKVFLSNSDNTSDPLARELAVRINDEDIYKDYEGIDAGARIKIGLTATICSVIGQGCANENVITEQCELIESNPKLIFKLMKMRSALTDSGYEISAPGIRNANVYCKKALQPEIKSFKTESRIWESYTYSVFVQMDVINHNREAATFNTEQDNFVIRAYLSAGNVNVTELSVPLDLAVYRHGFTQGETYSLNFTASLEMSNDECLQLSGQAANIRVYVADVAIAGYMDVTYHERSFSPTVFSCTDSYLDLSIPVLQLTDDVLGEDDYDLILDVSKSLALKVTLTSSGTMTFSSSASFNWEVLFYLSDDVVLDNGDQKIDHTFQKSVLLKGSHKARTIKTKILSSNGESGRLQITTAQGYKYCGLPKVYLIAVVEDYVHSNSDPNTENSVALRQINLKCRGELLALTSASIQPTHILQATKYEVAFSVTVRNQHSRDIPTNNDGKDNMYFEFFVGNSRISVDNYVMSNDVQTKVRSELKSDDSIELKDIKAIFDADSSLCSDLSSAGGLEIKVLPGLGLPTGFIDTVLENNVKTITGVTCYSQHTDIWADGFTIEPIPKAGGLFPTQGMDFPTFKFDVTFKLQLFNSKTLTGGSTKFTIKFWLSHDNKLDKQTDLALKYDPTDYTTQRNILQSSFTSSSVYTRTLSAEPNEALHIPDEAQLNYCGRSYLLVELDSANQLNEQNKENNVDSVEIFLACDKDVYDIENVQIYGQKYYFRTRETTLEFTADVYLVGFHDKIDNSTIGKNETNFKFKVYAQKGSSMNFNLAMDVTPIVWVFEDQEEQNLQDNHKRFDPIQFTRVKTSVVLPDYVCNTDVDHLFIGIELNRPDLSECILYNNYHRHPIACQASGAIDLQARIGRTGAAVFSLEENNDIILGEEKGFRLEIDVNVWGNGGWLGLSPGSESVFSYTFTITDGTKSTQIPHVIKSELINQNTQVSRTLVLDSKLLLTASDKFLPYCGTGRTIELRIDPGNKIRETNEINNDATLSPVTIKDDGSGICSNIIDLVVTRFDLSPSYVYQLEATNLPITAEQFMFQYDFIKGTNSASTPPTIRYNIVMSLERATSADSDISLVSKTTISVSNDKEYTSSFNVRAYSSAYASNQRFCGRKVWLRLEVEVGSGNELSTSNNFAWKEVKLSCQDWAGLMMYSLALIGTDQNSMIRDLGDTELSFNTSVLNTGKAIGVTADDNFQFLDNIKFEIYINANESIEGAYQFTSAVWSVPTDLKSQFLSEELQLFEQAKVTVNLPNDVCVGKKYLCIRVASGDGMTRQSLTEDNVEDNIICSSLVNGSVGLDCARDIKVKSLKIQPYKVTKIYQDTDIPMEYTVGLVMDGPSIPPGTSPRLGFDVYLKLEDGEKVLNNYANKTRYDSDTATTLTERIYPDIDYVLRGWVTINIQKDLCGNVPTVCLEYEMINMPIRESNATDDFFCQDIGYLVQCDNETVDLKPTFFGFSRHDLLVGPTYDHDFDLQVKVTLRGEQTMGSFVYDSAFYLSQDSELSDDDTKIEYSGFSFGSAKAQMEQFLTTGEKWIGLGGIPLKIPSVDSKYCGHSHIIAMIDSNSEVAERFEDNNLITTQVEILCPEDKFRLPSLELTFKEPIWAESNSEIDFTVTVQNMGETLEATTLAAPNYELKMKMVLASNARVDITKHIAYPQEYLEKFNQGGQKTLKSVIGTLLGSAITEARCKSMKAIEICVEPTQGEDTFTSNDCQTVDITADQKVCKSIDSQRDMKLLDFEMSKVIFPGETTGIKMAIRSYVGSNLVPLTDGAYINALYFSKQSSFDFSEATRMAVISSAKSQASGSTMTWVEVNEKASVNSLADNALCGPIYAYLVIDADRDFVESSENNNVGKAEVVVICSQDYFALTNFQFSTANEKFVPDILTEYLVEFDVTCTNPACKFGPSNDNIKVTTEFQVDGVAISSVDISKSPSIHTSFAFPGILQRLVTRNQITFGKQQCATDGTISVMLKVTLGGALFGHNEIWITNNNQVLKYPCLEKDERDLIASSLQLANGTSLVEDNVVRFSFRVELEGNALDRTDVTSPTALFSFAIWASRDNLLSSDDLDLGYQLTPCVIGTINKGIPTNGNTTIRDYTKGVKIPEGLCGKWYLLLHLDNTDRVKETLESNNIVSTQVDIACPKDIYEVNDASASIDTIWQGHDSKLKTNFTVVILSDVDILATEGRITFEPVAYLSDDAYFNIAKDKMISTGYSFSKEDLTSLTHSQREQGLKAGSTLKFKNLEIRVNVAATNCKWQRYLLIGILPAGHLPKTEKQLANNFNAFQINSRSLRCKEGVDIFSNGLISTDSATPGEEITVQQIIGLTVGMGEMLPKFKYDFWLSKDGEFDSIEDLEVTFVQPVDHPFSEVQILSTEETVTDTITLPEESVLPKELCGPVHLMVRLDAQSAIDETWETNNIGTTMLTLNCNNDTFAIYGFKSSINDNLWPNDASHVFNLAFTIICLDNNNCPESPEEEDGGKLFDWKVHALGAGTKMLSELVQTSPTFDPDILVHNFKVVKNVTVQYTSKLHLSNEDTCKQVRYLSFQLIKGTSVKMNGLSLGTVDNNKAIVPIRFNCSKRRVDVSLATGNIQVSNIDYTSDKFTISEAKINVISEHMPSRTDKTDPFCKVGIYLVQETGIAPTANDLLVTESKMVYSSEMQEEWGTKSAKLFEPNLQLEFKHHVARRLCGKPVFLVVKLDPQDELVEIDETNNQVEKTIQILNCPDGIDISLVSINMPVVAYSGDIYPTTVSLELVLVGRVELDDKQKNIDLMFSLVDSPTRTEEDHIISVNTDEFTELKSSIVDLTQEKGKAFVKTIAHNFTTFTIPSEYKYCGRPWFIKVETRFLTKTDQDLENNVLYQHIYIKCPEGDGLALSRINMKYFPTTWWGESTNKMRFTATVVNYQDKNLTMMYGADYLFTIKAFFSADDVLEQALDTEITIRSEGVEYFYRNGVNAGQSVETALLVGDLILETLDVCNQIKSAKVGPKIFFKLEPYNAADSQFSENDIVVMDVDQSKILCAVDNIDLFISEVKLIDRITGMIKEDMNANEPTTFEFVLGYTKTAVGQITRTLYTEPTFSYIVRVYLSTDNVLSEEDILVQMDYSKNQIEIMQRGINERVGSPIDFKGNNLLLDLQQHPEYSHYCGNAYLVVNITDLKNVNPIKDPVPENNQRTIGVFINCSGDLLTSKNGVIQPYFPQQKLFSDVPVKFRMQGTLENVGTVDIVNSSDERPAMYFRAFLSNDILLDFRRDPEVSIELAEESAGVKTSLMSKGIEAGKSVAYDMVMMVTMPLAACTFKPRYFLLYTMLGAQVHENEIIIGNNYVYADFKDIINCSVTSLDLVVEQFRIYKDFVTPGEELDFTVQLKVDLGGNEEVGNSTKRIASMAFYLSRDKFWDTADYKMPYQSGAIDNKLRKAFRKPETVDINGEIDKIAIPLTVANDYCGYVHLIAHIDSDHELTERNEHNNFYAIPILLHCYGDLFQISNVSVTQQKTYYRNTSKIELDFDIYNADVADLQNNNGLLASVKVLARRQQDGTAIEHDLTPEQWDFKFKPDSDINSLKTGLGFKKKVGVHAVGTVDLQSACSARIDTISTGAQTLLVRIVHGNGTLSTEDNVDCVPSNNFYEEVIDVDCGDSRLDFSIPDFTLGNLTFNASQHGMIEFGSNPFNLSLLISIYGEGGWLVHPVGNEAPQVFYYNFSFIDPLLGVKPIAYDQDKFKTLINEHTRDADKLLELSDQDAGLNITTKDFLYICNMDNVTLMLEVDTRNEVTEISEFNNRYYIPGLSIAYEKCPTMRDLTIHKWKILERHAENLVVANVKNDVVHAGKSYAYDLTIRAVLTGLANFHGLATTEYLHFVIKYFLSFDDELDEQDVEIPLGYSLDQQKVLQEHIKRGSVELVQINPPKYQLTMNDAIKTEKQYAENFVIPVNKDTYKFCWKSIYVGLQVDSANEHVESNEDNNLAFYEITFDCGDGIDECSRGYHDCDKNAVCENLVHNFYQRSGSGFTCTCKDGYRGDGKECANVNECVDVSSNGSVLHDCSNVQLAHCVDTDGSFECRCNVGYEMSIMNSERKCSDINECEGNSHMCHQNAICINNVGSYSCQCRTGYTGDGTTCVNIDDCLGTNENSHLCNDRGTCVDKLNGIMCSCNAHYEGEFCEIANGNWGQWSGYGECSAVCEEGIQTRFRECNSPAPSSMGRKCPWNESSVEQKPCDRLQCVTRFRWCDDDPCGKAQGGLCTLTETGINFKCACKPGFRRVTESGIFVRCEDQNECITIDKTGELMHSCSKLAECTNTLGSYTCECKSGYVGDGHMCADIDECEQGINCTDLNSLCRNIPGTFVCDCKTGFTEELVNGEPVCVKKQLLGYGKEHGDVLVTDISQLTSERATPIITVPHGLPISGQLYAESLYIVENGLIVLTDAVTDSAYKYTFRTPVPLSELTFKNGLLGIIAPIWVDVRTELNVSRIWYRAEKSDTKFKLVVTWEKVKPHYDSFPDEMNTFQAILESDYETTDIKYLYENKQMKWRPVYSPEERILYYRGYPAWIGLAVKTRGGTNKVVVNPQSGHWANTQDYKNAYRADQKHLSDDEGERGMWTHRLGSDEENSRRKCAQWYNNEPEVTTWASDQIGICPASRNQADNDIRFVEDGKTTKYICYLPVIPGATQATVRCCYQVETGSLLTDLATFGGLTVKEYEEAGFLAKYPRNSESYIAYDKNPFDWCCKKARQFHESYCKMYVEKRPLASTSNYDRLTPALVGGDPHFITFDGLNYTFNGYGEYVLLRSIDSEKGNIEIQIRTTKVKHITNNTIKATAIGGVAVKVGEKKALQAYAMSQRKLDGFVESTAVSQVNSFEPGTYVKQVSDGKIFFVFKSGLCLNVTIHKGFLAVVVYIPQTLLSRHIEGLLGNADGDPSNDLRAFTKNTDDIRTATADDIHNFAETWSLRVVYGQSRLPGLASAITHSFFTQGYNAEDAISYMDPSYSPYMMYTTSYQNNLAGCSGNKQCLYDWKTTGDSEVALTTKTIWEEFWTVRAILDNRAPWFKARTTQLLTTIADHEVIVSIYVEDEDQQEMELDVVFTESAVVRKEHLRTTNVTDKMHRANYFAKFDEGSADTILSFNVTDKKGATALLAVRVVLCNCKNYAICDYGNLQTVSESRLLTFSSCKCPERFTGTTCTSDRDACYDKPCFTECNDVAKSEVMDKDSSIHYRCQPCPKGMHGRDGSCFDVNECIQPLNNPSRHQCEQICINTPGSYACACREGFTLAEDRRRCVDNQNCITPSENPCDPRHGVCRDTPGSVSCSCETGYQLATDNKSCLDLNECLVNNGGCQQLCRNTVGSYRCECFTGYEVHWADSMKCIDRDECKTSEHQCSQRCINLPGRYRCSCYEGYALNRDGKSCSVKVGCLNQYRCDITHGYCATINSKESCFCSKGYMLYENNKKDCFDVNECSQKIHTCNKNSVCRNTVGDYECDCKPGFYKNPLNPKECIDYNECNSNNGGCDHMCVNLEGSFKCQCQKGYSLTSTGKSCIDMNECSPGSRNDCSNDAECHNIIGSYSCKCKPGFSGDGFTCTDNNECLINNGNCSMGCVNTRGGHRCTCIEGYEVDPDDPTQCVDINECQRPNVPCKHNCLNVVGSYKCFCKESFQLAADGVSCEPVQSCSAKCGDEGGKCILIQSVKQFCQCNKGYDKGYTQDTEADLDPCLDLNECVKEHKCDESSHARCQNKIGTYKCECDSGYEPRGNATACFDTDECNPDVPEKLHKCDLEASVCENFKGGYNCTCKSGFTQTDGQTCKDVDECDSGISKCSANANCQNTKGGYTCSCKPGFLGDGFYCGDNNECASPSENTCDQVSEDCVNKNGTYACVCKAGFKLSTLRKCEDIDECRSPNLNDCQDQCTNYPGTYKCSCHPGYQLQNDGKSCVLISPCTREIGCQQGCANVNGSNYCVCDQRGWHKDPFNNRKCLDIDECNPENKFRLHRCGVHSSCRNTEGSYKCACDKYYLSDMDGLACSETDGNWGKWSVWASCSKGCSGRQSRRRHCDSPRPTEKRSCRGKAAEFILCPRNCAPVRDQIKTGVFVDLENLETEYWESVEEAFKLAFTDKINAYCRANYQTCCKKEPPSNWNGQGEFLVRTQIFIGQSYPKRKTSGTRALIYMNPVATNSLCYEAEDSRKKRDTARIKRQASNNANQQILLDATNNGDALVASYLQKLDEADLTGNISYTVTPAEMETTTTTSTTAKPAPVASSNALEDHYWALIVVGCVIVVGTLVAIIALIIVRTCADGTRKIEPTPVPTPQPSDDPRGVSDTPVSINFSPSPFPEAGSGILSPPIAMGALQLPLYAGRSQSTTDQRQRDSGPARPHTADHPSNERAPRPQTVGRPRDYRNELLGSESPVMVTHQEQERRYQQNENASGLTSARSGRSVLSNRRKSLVTPEVSEQTAL